MKNIYYFFTCSTPLDDIENVINETSRSKKLSINSLTFSLLYILFHLSGFWFNDIRTYFAKLSTRESLISTSSLTNDIFVSVASVKNGQRFKRIPISKNLNYKSQKKMVKEKAATCVVHVKMKDIVILFSFIDSLLKQKTNFVMKVNQKTKCHVLFLLFNKTSFFFSFLMAAFYASFSLSKKATWFLSKDKIQRLLLNTFECVTGL